MGGMADGDALAIWLRQQLDEEKQLAWVADAEMWAVEEGRRTWQDDLSGAFWVTSKADEGPRIAMANGRVRAEHIARHDPARVLRSIEAKREILGEAESLWNSDSPTVCAAGLAIMQQLAAEYADRPGYAEATAP